MYKLRIYVANQTKCNNDIVGCKQGSKIIDKIWIYTFSSFKLQQHLNVHNSYKFQLFQQPQQEFKLISPSNTYLILCFKTFPFKFVLPIITKLVALNLLWVLNHFWMLNIFLVLSNPPPLY